MFGKLLESFQAQLVYNTRLTSAFSSSASLAALEARVVLLDAFFGDSAAAFDPLPFLLAVLIDSFVSSFACPLDLPFAPFLAFAFSSSASCSQYDQ